MLTHQIWSRSIQWAGIAEISTKLISSLVVDIVVRINNKPCCSLPPFQEWLATAVHMTWQALSIQIYAGLESSSG